MSSLPRAFALAPNAENVMNHYDSHVVRHLSSMTGYYVDQVAFTAQLAAADPVLYEVYGIERPAVSGELISGVTRLYAGKVGQEYFMTKGHFHAVLETGEIYYALRGQGLLVLETPEGDCSVQSFDAGQVVYIPPRWAHRTINTGADELLFFWVCPAHAGHDYASIAQHGFRQVVVEIEGKPTVQENPRWTRRA